MVDARDPQPSEASSLRISFISQWYAPEMGDGGIPRGIATALSRRGHEVEVLTGFPNYPEGRLYPGYRLRPYQRDVVDDLAVHRAPLYVSHDTNALRRFANYGSFAASATAIGLARMPRTDVSLVYSSPITAAVPAIALRARRRTPYVLLVQDMWPQSLTASGFLRGRRGDLAERSLHRFCDLVYQRAAAIAVTSPGMADLIVDRGIEPSKIHFIPNWVDEMNYRPEAHDEQLKKSLGLKRRFTVMYAGNFGEAQGLETIIDAAALLRDNSEVEFALVGSGVAEPMLRGRVADAGLDNVIFTGSQSAQAMPSVLAVADLQLVSLRPRELFRKTLPSKIQSLLAAARPILGCVEGDAAQVIESARAGWTTPPGSSAGIASAVAQIATLDRATLTHIGSVGREYYLKHFSSLVGTERLEALLNKAADASRTQSGTT